jgi:molybdenum cofactor cytidylyltransferase
VKVSVAAIVLAGGASTRLGQPKQLLMHGGETLLERAIRLATEAGAVPVIAVLGANFEIICASISLDPAMIAINDDWQKGISTSIHTGLKALDAVEPNTAGALIMACDQPRLTSDQLRTLIETFAAQEDPSIVASAYAGVLGIPAAFPRVAFPHLLALHGDKGARALLIDPPCLLIAAPFAGGEVDIDQPEDLTQLL